MLSQRRLWRLLHARRWCLRHRSILMGRDKWNVFPIVALYCEPSPAMSASRPAAAAIATVSTGVGVGAGFRNPAPARNANQAPARNVPPASTTAAAHLVVTAPTMISHQQIKQFQAFLRQFAWIAVREMASMRVAEQKRNLMIHYKGFINMFLDGTLPYTNIAKNLPDV